MSDTTAAAYSAELVASNLLLPTGVPGVFGRSGTFERVLEAVDHFVTDLGAAEGGEVMRFPPTMSRRHFETSGYMKGFPQFAGTIHCFCGDEQAHRRVLRCIEEEKDWTDGQQAVETVLAPAACYPVYPVLAARGAVADTGKIVDVASWCFRHEPSVDPTRMQAFRMREFVCVGAPEAVIGFRQRWLDRGPAVADALGLEAAFDVANDPFFGRVGQLKADSQREQGLKFEMLIPVSNPAKPTACMSFNYHQALLATAFGLRLPDGSAAHTGCVAFGMERLTLALFRQHGLALADWPQAIRRRLAV